MSHIAAQRGAGKVLDRRLRRCGNEAGRRLQRRDRDVRGPGEWREFIDSAKGRVRKSDDRQNASSISSLALLLTTEALVSEIRGGRRTRPRMPNGGAGMGGMY